MYRRACVACFCVVSWLFFVLPIAEAQPQKQQLLHVAIKADIDVRTHRYLQLALDEAKDLQVQFVILELDTFGGTLVDADKMRQLLLAFERPVYVFINRNAASAGALLAIACDSIYMAPGASIGAATVVSGGGGAAAPDKYQSYMRGIMRATAEARGRNPQLAEAMVDPTVVIPDGLAPAGKVLTLTTQQALRYGFCEAEISSLEGLLQHLSLQGYSVLHYELSRIEHIITFFINPVISSILILALIWGIYAELQSPGVGLPGLVVVTAGLLYLVPYYLNGLAAHWELALLFLGIGLLALEVFVVPGFGVPGITGLVLVVTALILVMLDNAVFDFSWVSPTAIMQATMAVLAACVGGVLLIFFTGDHLLKMPFFRRLALPNNMEVATGYRVTGGRGDAKNSLLGKRGIVCTTLKPCGKIKIDEKIYEAIMSTGSYVPVGEAVEVTSEEGRELTCVQVPVAKK